MGFTGAFAAADAASAAFVATLAISVATLLPVVTMSDATDFPAAATPPSTFAALFRRPTVSVMAEAETLPARSVSSTPSVNR